MENNLSKETSEILQYLYDKTDSLNYIQMEDLEIEFGISINQIRKYIEILKDDILVFENEMGIQISENGINYAKSRWL